MSANDFLGRMIPGAPILLGERVDGRTRLRDRPSQRGDRRASHLLVAGTLPRRRRGQADGTFGLDGMQAYLTQSDMRDSA